jgi:phage shock protein E
MRTLFTLLTVTCLITGCASDPPATETAGTDTGTSSAADSTGESTEASAETSKPASEETATPEETAADSEESTPLVIDVRTQAEWDEGHLEIAKHIPLDQITERIGDVAPLKDQKIYLHCRSGGRSGQAMTQLQGLGYTNVENAGGLEEARAKFESGQD